MSASIPLIRAAAIAPMLRWLVELGRDPDPFLARAGLHWVPADNPMLPIPLRSAFRLLSEIARGEGPDAPFRIVDARSGFEIGQIGMEALRGPTVRAGLHRIARAMPFHCTHEVFTVEDGRGALHVRDGWTTNNWNEEDRHFVQQYVAALVETVCRIANDNQPSARRIAMVAHPVAGLSHLRPWLGDRVAVNEERILHMEIPDVVADRLFPTAVREAAASSGVGEWLRLRSTGTFSDDVATLLEGMLPRLRPSVDILASAAGLSSRTLRRRLREEGYSFTDVVERTRARIALSMLGAPDAPSLKHLAAQLGYAEQSTLTRAVKRWTGQSPSALRRGLLDDP